MRTLPIMMAFILAAGCAPVLPKDQTTLASIARDAGTVFSGSDPEGDVSRAAWPRLEGLERAYLRPEGLYLRMFGILVSERGYFVPRHPTEFVIHPGGDPSYRLLGAGVYFYQIKG